MKNILLILTVFTFLTFLLLACSDEPNDVGTGVLPGKDALKVDSMFIPAVSDSMYLLRNTGSSYKLLVGNYADNHDTIEARTLLQFVNFTLIPENAVIDSAVLALNINYRFKDSMNPISFEVHEILTSWSEETFTWDNCKPDSFFSSVPDRVTSPEVIARDTVVTLDIKHYVRKWVHDGTGSPNGIMLMSDKWASNIVLGIDNYDVPPVLTVGYRDSSDSSYVLKFLPQQSMFVANANLKSSSKIQYIQAGISYRNCIKFNPEVFKRLRNVSITEATLRISTSPPDFLVNSYSDKRLVTYFTKDSLPPFNYLALSTLCTYDELQQAFLSDVRNIVQQWVTINLNPIIVLRAYNEPISLDRFAVYRSKDSTYRPQLKIKYTILP